MYSTEQVRISLELFTKRGFYSNIRSPTYEQNWLRRRSRSSINTTIQYTDNAYVNIENGIYRGEGNVADGEGI